MAQGDNNSDGGGSSVVLVIAVAAALTVLIVFIGVNRLTGPTMEEETTALDERDLLAVANRRRLPDSFTPAPDLTGDLPIEAQVYVPAYSSIYVGQGTVRSNLAATLSIRNTSLTDAIVIRAVRYYDTDGDLVSTFIEQPHRLGAMATADFFVDSSDVRGGTGANFVVDWASEQAVSEPLIEAVMVGSVGAKGISFVSRGRRVGTPREPLPMTQ